MTASIEQPGGVDEATPQRGATRAPVRKPVRLQFDDSIEVFEAICHNVSIGGMFVHSNEGRPVGALVRFELLLEGESSIRGLAEVVWMRSQDHGPERVAGMGLKFRFLEQRDRQLIFKLVSQHIKERLAARHPGLSDEPAEPDAAPKPPPIRAAASTVERMPKPGPSAPSPARPVPDAQVAAKAVPEPPPEGDPYETSVTVPPVGNPDSFAGADAPSSAWMQDGLVDEPSYAPLVEDEGHGSHLYDDAEHFEHRPKPRREVPVLTLVALLVTALAAAGYLWGDRWFGGDDGAQDVADAPAAVGEGAAATATAGDGRAEGAAAAPEGASDAAAGDQTADGTAEPPRVVDTGLPFVPAEPVTQPAARDPQPRTADPPPSTTSTPAPTRTAPPASSSGQPFREVRDISARVVGPTVEIVITTDGSVTDSRFSHSRISGGAPRELIRLRGLGRKFDTESIPVGIGAVRQIRTGWHRNSSGNELHVVIDLSTQSAKVTSVRVEGSRIIATITG